MPVPGGMSKGASRSSVQVNLDDVETGMLKRSSELLVQNNPDSDALKSDRSGKHRRKKSNADDFANRLMAVSATKKGQVQSLAVDDAQKFSYEPNNISMQYGTEG